MGWLIALGILAGLAVLPLGISALYDSDGAVIRVVAGPLKIKVFPLKKKGKRKVKAQKKQDVPKKQPAQTEQTGDGSSSGGSGSNSLSDITTLLSTVTYADYISQYSESTPRPDGFSVEINADTVNADKTDAPYVLVDKDHAKYGDISAGISGGAILVADSGTVTFNINAEKAGLYILARGNPDLNLPLTVAMQEPAAGTMLEPGCAIKLTFTDPAARD